LYVPKGYSSVLEANITIFWSRYGLPDFIFLFLGELCTCTRKIICTGGVDLSEKVHFVEGGVLKFISKGIIYTINYAFEK
jgi:hypothetical protein